MITPSSEILCRLPVETSSSVGAGILLLPHNPSFRLKIKNILTQDKDKKAKMPPNSRKIYQKFVSFPFFHLQ